MTTDLHVTPPTNIGIATYPPGATYGPRKMRDYEFVWMIEGHAEYAWGEQTVQVGPGSIVLCRPGGEDFFRWDAGRRTRHAFFHFDIHSTPTGWPPRDQWPLVRQLQEGDVLRPLFRHLLTWRQRGDRLLIELAVAQMLVAYLTGQIAAGDVPHDALPDTVERALAHIHATLEADPSAAMTLDDIASAAAVTPAHLCRLFRGSVGLSPAETVRLARLDRAAVLLARTNFAVGRIAALCGFASPFHFSRRFRQAYGCAPRELRRRVLAGRTPPTPKLTRILRGI
jgi:AraC family transcriptional regulator